MHFVIDKNVGDSIWFTVLRYIVLATGLLLDIILLLFLSKHKISSKKASMIIKTSTFVDILILIILSLSPFQEEEYFYSTSTTYAIFYCYYRYKSNFFWIVVTTNIYLIVSLILTDLFLLLFHLYTEK